MKRLIVFILTLSMLLVSVTGLVWAEAQEASTDSGFYSITNNDEQIEIAVQTSLGAIVASQTDLVNCESGSVIFYPNSEKLVVTVSGITSGAQCLVLLVTGNELPDSSSEICYINQDASNADNKVSFTVYPMLPTQTTQMALFITSNAEGFVTKSVTLNYAVGYTLGDVDRDGTITATDALYALQMAVGKGNWTDAQKLAAEVDGSADAITATDALYILQAAVGKRTF